MHHKNLLLHLIKVEKCNETMLSESIMMHMYHVTSASPEASHSIEEMKTSNVYRAMRTDP